VATITSQTDRAGESKADRQRSDRIGRTVWQTITQKCWKTLGILSRQGHSYAPCVSPFQCWNREVASDFTGPAKKRLWTSLHIVTNDIAYFVKQHSLHLHRSPEAKNTCQLSAVNMLLLARQRLPAANMMSMTECRSYVAQCWLLCTLNQSSQIINSERNRSGHYIAVMYILLSTADISHTSWRSATKFGSVRGLTNRHSSNLVNYDPGSRDAMHWIVCMSRV